jgi:hypothetical protein
MILTHKVIILDEGDTFEDAYVQGLYDDEETAQQVADSYNYIYDNYNPMMTAHVVSNIYQ